MSTVNTNTGSTTSINDLMSTMNAKADHQRRQRPGRTDKFMTLLVTQLKNQDPLNPLDNAQVTSQLAQLQTVTGVNKLNDTLESLKSSYQSSEAMQATNLIGHGVLVEGSNVTLSGSKAIMGVELGSDADNVQVVISDKTGKEVADHGPGRAEGRRDAAGLGRRARSDKSTATASRSRWPTAITPSGRRHQGRRQADRRQGPVLRQRGQRHHQFEADGVKLNLPVKGAVTLADIKQVL
jgi:flagellar basal-body rod modification protein FlgD